MKRLLPPSLFLSLVAIFVPVEFLRPVHRLDQMIDGLRHAMSCPRQQPFDCDGFRAHLPGVLPVTRDATYDHPIMP